MVYIYQLEKTHTLDRQGLEIFGNPIIADSQTGDHAESTRRGHPTAACPRREKLQIARAATGTACRSRIWQSTRVSSGPLSHLYILLFSSTVSPHHSLQADFRIVGKLGYSQERVTIVGSQAEKHVQRSDASQTFQDPGLRNGDAGDCAEDGCHGTRHHRARPGNCRYGRARGEGQMA